MKEKNKAKKEKQQPSNKSLFSYSSDFPNGSTVRSALIGGFQDLPLRLVVTPDPPFLSLFPEFFRVLDCFPQVPTFQVLDFTPEGVHSVLRFISKSYSFYRIHTVRFSTTVDGTIITNAHVHTQSIRDKNMDRSIPLIPYLGLLTTISSRYLVHSTLMSFWFVLFSF